MTVATMVDNGNDDVAIVKVDRPWSDVGRIGRLMNERRCRVSLVDVASVEIMTKTAVNSGTKIRLSSGSAPAVINPRKLCMETMYVEMVLIAYV